MLESIKYDRDAVVRYATEWALFRNPSYYNFEGIGGNCTNFASQCVFAGCGVMNYTKTFGWYYISQNDRSPSWTGVEYFYNFMTQNTMQGPTAVDVGIESALPGDVLQLGDFNGGFYHSLVVLSVADGEIYIAANTNDALYRPLSDYSYSKIRCIHFTGALKWT